MKETEIDKDLEAFEKWWYNEGSEGPIRNDAEVAMDTEEFVYTRCKEAWLNGAYVARE